MRTIKRILRILAKILIGIIVLFLAFILTNSVIRVYKGDRTNHFNGKEFFNPEPDHTFWEMIKWYREMETIEWPEWIEDEKQPAPPEYAHKGEIRITYVNHATMLIQCDSLNILTDPIWSERAGLFNKIGIKRTRKPGIKMDSLPPIHYVLISHNHFDHMDIATLKEIDKRYNPQIICGLGVKRQLKRRGFSKVTELDWWEGLSIDKQPAFINFVPALHQSGRGVFDGNKTLWGGFVIEFNSKKIYFAGDTGFGSFIDSLKNKYDTLDVAILPLGNYEARWIMKYQHMNPDDAVKIHKLFNVKQSIGMHFSTFAEHPEQTIDQHEKDLKNALFEHKVNPIEFIVPKFGEGVTVR